MAADLYFLSKFSPQVIYHHILKAYIKLCIDNIFVDHLVIQTNSGAEAVFRTMVGSPATFKEELSAPREALIKAGSA